MGFDRASLYEVQLNSLLSSRGFRVEVANTVHAEQVPTRVRQ